MNYFKNLYLTTFRIIITKLPFIPPKRSDKQIKVTRINKLGTSAKNEKITKNNNYYENKNFINHFNWNYF